MLYIDIGQWEHTVRGAQYDKVIWCWRKLSNMYASQSVSQTFVDSSLQFESFPALRY